MKHLKLLFFVALLSIFALQLSAQVTLDLTYGSDVDTELKASSETPTTEDPDLYWLDEGTYTATGTSQYDGGFDDIGYIYDHPFNGSLGISDGVTLTAKGIRDNWRLGLNVNGDIYQNGGEVSAIYNGDIGIYLKTGSYNLSGGNFKAENNHMDNDKDGALYIISGNFNMDV